MIRVLVCADCACIAHDRLRPTARCHAHVQRGRWRIYDRRHRGCPRRARPARRFALRRMAVGSNRVRSSDRLRFQDRHQHVADTQGARVENRPRVRAKCAQRRTRWCRSRQGIPLAPAMPRRRRAVRSRQPDGRVFTWTKDRAPMRHRRPDRRHRRGSRQRTRAGGRAATGMSMHGAPTDPDNWATALTRSANVRFVCPVSTNVVDAVAGRSHSLALTADGRVFAWGANARGQLGIDSTKPSAYPLRSLRYRTSWPSTPATHTRSRSRAPATSTPGAPMSTDSSATDRETIAVPRSGSRSTMSIAVAAGVTTRWRSLAMVRSTRGAPAHADSSELDRPGWLLRPPVSTVCSQWRSRRSELLRRRPADGALMMWGANDSGQLGDGTSSIDQPPVRGPAIAGAQHARSWQPSFDCGDGRGRRLDLGLASAPTTTLSGIADWGPPMGTVDEVQPPTMQPPSAAYPAPQTVTLTAAGSDHTLRYTLDGTDPTTESDDLRRAVRGARDHNGQSARVFIGRGCAS